MAEPLCPYFRRCGGCLYQHIDYPEQLRKKAAAVEQATGLSSIEVFSDEPYFYRHRMDFIFHPGGLGLRERRRWWRVVDIERCVIAAEPLNGLIQEIRHFFHPVEAFDLRSKRGTFRFAVIRTTSLESSISIVLNEEAKNLTSALDQVRQWAESTSAQNIIATFVPPNRDVSVSENYQVIKGRPFLETELLGQKFQFPVQGFFQNNPKMTERLHRFCRSILENHSGGRASLLDLYAGVGPFGLLNADLFDHVYLVENYGPAVQAAKQNALRQGKKNVIPILAEAKEIQRLPLPSPSVVVADPPRSGLHPKVLKYLNHIKPKVILYISCNIRQLRHDLAALSGAYQAQRIALFDFFPQTPHLEVAVELQLSSGNKF
jgi:23S rRNA (uracil-5-)-methyltransferase RumA